MVAILPSGCTAKQRNFSPTDPITDPTQAREATSEPHNPGANDTADAAQAANATEAGLSVGWSPDSSGAASSGTTEANTERANTASSAVASAISAEPNPDTRPATFWDDLVLHLTMDDADWISGGTVHDGSAAANHGIINGSVTQTVDGKFDKAAVFDGDGWISVPDADSLDASSALTMSAWVNFGYVEGDYSPGIISKRAGYGDDTAYALFLWDQDKVWVDVDYETDRFGSAVIFETNRWYHVAVVYDGGVPAAERIHLYVDGVLDSIASEASSEIPAYDCDLEVGRLINGGNTMIGMIDEVAVWRRALGPEEITLLSQYPLQ
jgi:hypothetical protein